ncbi:hypothetical protein [uncultured Aquimarina sp.]|uniref:hypothetical protein n=1 Tax=uncultured Aquimarina sp. TaxID=575652 RepID=UPI00262EBB4F|nr:hypothetical protein [uncultured Aquimarina sp.]
MEQRINLKKLLTKISLLGILLTFTQCATSQKIDKTVPVELSSPYFQKWVSGVRGGGYGFILYFPVKSKTDMVLNTAYFKGKKVELRFDENKSLYSGKYKDPQSEERDLIMNGDSKKEYGNKAPQTEEKIPFALKEGECIVAYTKAGKEGYFRLDELPEKELKAYPMQARPRQ